MNFKSKKWTIPLLLVLIVLSVGIFIKFSLGFASFDRDFKGLFPNSFSQNPFAKQSEVSISVIDSKLKLDFKLLEEDKPKFQAFTKRWFGVSEEIKTLDLGIDENLTALVAPNLPVDLELTISDKSLEFKNQNLPGLQNALIRTDFEFATGSGKLSVKYTDSSRYRLEIENPEELVFYATSSGFLMASDKLEGLFKSLPKVATIELNVNGKSILGSI